jgi:predicted anti-sigma-YlaC factor YlaD
MTAGVPKLSETCALTLAEIEARPLDLSAAAEAHLGACPACSEARVAWLALEEASAQAPAGYFDRLPDRILAKLPATPRRLRPRHLVLWALAAGLLAAVGTGGFLAGRANRAPMVEATLAEPAAETRETLPDVPFQEGGEDDYAQLPDLSPEEAHRILERVRTPQPRP